MAGIVEDYLYWRLALEGRASEWTGIDPLMHTAPQCGFWKQRNGPRGGAWSPVAIWRDGEKLVALAGDRPLPATEVWSRCGAHPVSYEDYEVARQTGEWPGEIPHAVGHNQAPDEFHLLKENIEDSAAQAERWLASVGEIATDADMDKAANWRDALNRLEKKADTRRKEEKDPLAAQVKAIDLKYGAITSRAKTVANLLRDALTMFMRKKEAAERARVAEERKRAEEERRRLADMDVALAAVEPAIPEAKAAPIRAGGQLGRATALKSSWSASITDYGAALQYFKDCAEVRDLIQKLANAAARAKSRQPIPGVEFKEVRTAA